jgi:hypothetical protein
MHEISHDDFNTTQVLLLFDIVMFWKLVDMQIFTPNKFSIHYKIPKLSAHASCLWLRLHLTFVDIVRKSYWLPTFRFYNLYLPIMDINSVSFKEYDTIFISILDTKYISRLSRNYLFCLTDGHIDNKQMTWFFREFCVVLFMYIDLFCLFVYV